MKTLAVFTAAAGALAAAVAHGQRAPYQPPAGQRIVQGVADAAGYVIDGKWVPGFIYSPKLPQVTDPNAFDRPGKWQGESRPGYWCSPTPQSVAFYRYIMEEAGRGEPINTAEALTIRRMIANRTWPEAPKVSEADRAARGWADRQPEGASILNPSAWSRGFVSDIVYGNLAEAGKLEEDKPHSKDSDAFRRYWHSLTPEERRNLPLGQWMYNRMVRLGFDMRSDEQREADGKYEAERRRREQEAAAAREEAERRQEEAARKEYERQQEWFKEKWAEEDRRIEAEAARERLAEAIRKSKEEGGEAAGQSPAARSVPDPTGGSTVGGGEPAADAERPGADGESGGMARADLHAAGGETPASPEIPPPDETGKPIGRGQTDGAGAPDGTGRSTGQTGTPGDHEGRVAGGKPDSADGPAAEPAMTAGGVSAAGGDDGPRNDAGEKVDAGRYQSGDRVITADGKEFENKGGKWVATGENYGPYSPDGLRGSEPPAGAAASGDGAATAVGAGLVGFADRRGERMNGHAEASMGLAAGKEEMNRAATAGDAADRDARNTVDSAGRDAQGVKSVAASKTAAEDRANSFGKAIGDGLQQGIEKGMAAAGETFGKAAADKAAGAIFKDGSSDIGKGGGGDGGGAAPPRAGAPRGRPAAEAWPATPAGVPMAAAPADRGFLQERSQDDRKNLRRRRRRWCRRSRQRQLGSGDLPGLWSRVSWNQGQGGPMPLLRHHDMPALWLYEELSARTGAGELPDVLHGDVRTLRPSQLWPERPAAAPLPQLCKNPVQRLRVRSVRGAQNVGARLSVVRRLRGEGGWWRGPFGGRLTVRARGRNPDGRKGTLR